MRIILYLVLSFFCVQNIFAQTPGTKKWEYISPLNMNSPAIGADGTVYAFTDSATLTAINSDGSKKWDKMFPLGIGWHEYSQQEEQSAPVVGLDGTLYAVAYNLYALNSDGTEKWIFPKDGELPALSGDGTIYFNTFDGMFYALNPDGTVKWDIQTENIFGPAPVSTDGIIHISPPSISSDGTIYFGYGKNLFALNPDGTKKWKLQTDVNIYHLPVIGAKGIIYINSGTTLLAVNSDGTLNWETQTTFEISSSLAIGADGTIYGSHKGYSLYAFDLHGNKKWEFLTDSSYSSYRSSTPAIGSNGLIYVGLGHNLYAVNPNGTEQWKFVTDGPISQSSPVITDEGTICFGSWDGKFYALYSGNSGLADSPWPRFRKNNQNLASSHNVNCPVAKVVESNFSLKNGGQITLDASPSYDPNGDDLVYLWRIVEKPQGSPLTLSDSTSAVITVDIPSGQFASYRFSLKVTDNEDGESWTPVFVNSGKKWEFMTGRGVYSSPVISGDGTVYTISDKLYAINNDGSTKWEYEIDGGYLSLNSDGIIYVSSWDNRLYAFNSDGTKIWEFETDNRLGPPVTGIDGTIYVTSRDDGLFALNPDGTKLWKFETSGSVGPPVVGSDGTVYFYFNGKLFALNADGKKEWTVDVGYSPDSPAIGADGTIYVNSQGTLYAIKPDGTKKWKLQVGLDSYSSSPVIDSNGTIYFGSDNLYAANPNGTKKWEFETGSVFTSTPAIGSAGTIFVGSYDSSFYAINPDGTEKWSFKTAGSVSSSPAIDSEGVVYFGSTDNNLYALYTESLGLADSPWPKYRKNNQNTAGSYNENCPQAQVTDDFISIQSGGQVTLDGSSSYDPDGEALSYLWRIAEKPQGSSVVLTDSTSAVISVDIPQDVHETYRFSLTITDNDDGYSSASIIVSTALKWEFDLGSYGEEVSSPAIDFDGTVYIGSDNTLYAVNPDGTEKWQFQYESGYDYDRISSAVISDDGTIFVGIYTKLFALNSSGEKKWEFEALGRIYASPSVSSDGAVYIISNSYNGFSYKATLHSIKPDGTKKWEALLGYAYVSFSPVIGSDGTIYIASREKLFAFNSDGSKKWQINLGYNGGSSLAIGLDGTVYVGSDTLFAINLAGTKKWGFEVGYERSYSPVIGTDGTIYVGSDDSTLYAINPDGTEKWTFNIGYEHLSTPAIGEDGTLFISSDNYYDGKLYALNPNGTKKWEIETGVSSSSSPAIASDGTVYICSSDGKLSAIYSDCGGLADSPWPKFNKDNQNTANGFNPKCPQAKVTEKFISIKDGGYATLDGSPSYDPDGDALSYLWRVLEKPQGNDFTLSDSTSAIINIKIPEGKRISYRFSLTVTDNDDGSSWTALTVSSEMKWVLETDGGMGSPAISEEGTFYYSSGNSLYAVNPNGTKKWELPGRGSWTSPAISSDGTIFAMTFRHWGWGRVDEDLYAINHDGSVKWTAFSDSSGSLTYPAIDMDGTIYIGYDKKLFAINPDSTKKWVFDPQTGSRIYYAPVINSNGIVYVCSDKKLFAVNSNGKKQWEYEAPDYIYSSPIIASDGTIYICSQQKLLAISSSGTKKWESGNGDYNPVIGKDNTIYLGYPDGLAAISPFDGTKKWEFLTGAGISSPAIGADGTLFFGSGNYENPGKFYALNPDGSEKWCFETDGYDFSSPAIDPFGTIYIGCANRFYALYSECGGLADSPWPKYRHDNRNTGYVNTPTPIKDLISTLPKTFELSQNYPNPFNPATTIIYQLPKHSKVDLSIYNILGQKVTSLVSEKQAAGYYKVEWDASGFASGVYFYRLSTNKSFLKTRKLILLK